MLKEGKTKYEDIYDFLKLFRWSSTCASPNFLECIVNEQYIWHYICYSHKFESKNPLTVIIFSTSYFVYTLSIVG